MMVVMKDAVMLPEKILTQDYGRKFSNMSEIESIVNLLCPKAQYWNQNQNENIDDGCHKRCNQLANEKILTQDYSRKFPNTSELESIINLLCPKAQYWNQN